MSGTTTRSEWRLLALLATLVAFGPLATDLYLPALPAIAAGLGSSIEEVQWSITVFLAGFALGMLAYGPLSDRYGRRPTMLAGISLFVLGSLGCLLAGRVDYLYAARLAQALGGGAAWVLARTAVRDLYPPIQAVRKLSLLAMVTAVAPLMAPLLGAILLNLFGWRAPFGWLLGWGLFALLIVWSRFPETLPVERRDNLPLAAAFGAYARLLADPASVGLLLAGGMSFAAMFAYITAGPFFFIELNGLSPFSYSVVFAANALGIFLVSYLNSRLVRTRGPATMAGFGCAAGLAGALGLLLAVSGNAPLPASIIALFLVVSTTGLLGANCVGILMARFPANSGAAAAMFGACQFGFGMLASAAVSFGHDGSGRPMAWTILAAGVIAMSGYRLYRAVMRRESATLTPASAD